jgi:hypothetical protein
VARLGEPRIAFRASRKSLVWSFLLALLPCGVVIAAVVIVVRMLADWSGDIFGVLALLA